MNPTFSKPKKIKKSTLKNKADKLFSLWVRRVGVCELAGKDTIHCGGNLQTMHIFTRGITSLRYNPINVVCGCAGHHVYYTFHPEDWVALVAKWFPEKWEWLIHHREDKVKKTEDLYREVIEKYKKLNKEAL